MPRHDGTGPMGEGPVTAGGFGYCRSGVGSFFWARSSMLNTSGFQGSAGRGFRQRIGRGRRFDTGFWTNSGSWDMPVSVDDEVEWLKGNAGAMETELETIRKRITELEKIQKGDAG